MNHDYKFNQFNLKFTKNQNFYQFKNYNFKLLTQIKKKLINNTQFFKKLKITDEIYNTKKKFTKINFFLIICPLVFNLYLTSSSQFIIYIINKILHKSLKKK